MPPEAETETIDARRDARPQEARGDRLLGAGAVGAVLAGLGALSCCVLPLALFGAGVGGAWLSNLTALAPYQPVFIAAAALFIGVGFWRVYRRRPEDCGGYCATAASRRVAKSALWIAILLVLAAVAFNYAAPYLFPAE